MAQPKEDTVISIPDFKMRKHINNIAGIYRVSAALEDDNFNRRLQSLSHMFYKCAAGVVFIGAVSCATTPPEKDNVTAPVASALIAAFMARIGYDSRPKTKPLGHLDRLDLEKELAGRRTSINNFYSDHFQDNPAYVFRPIEFVALGQ